MFIENILLLLAASFLFAGLVPALENRIIGGRSINIEEAPWQVFLTAKGNPHCGGSIYSKDFIITAAHCFYNEKDILLKAKDFLVYVGSENWRSPDTKRIKVATIKHHEKYTGRETGYRNDVGIMKLSESLKLTTKVQPIPLATRSPAPGSMAWSTGWGVANILGISYYPNFLKGIIIPINEFALCKLHLPWMTEGTICAGAGGSSACRGDSGGPLVVGNELVGVVSTGRDNCASAGAYASVAFFRKWILSTIKAI